MDLARTDRDDPDQVDSVPAGTNPSASFTATIGLFSSELYVEMRRTAGKSRSTWRSTAAFTRLPSR